jgi:5-methylcytosine-specific restriction endonuclease McrA
MSPEPCEEPDTQTSPEDAFSKFAVFSKKFSVDDGDCVDGFRFKCYCGRIVRVYNPGVSSDDLDCSAECERCGRKFDVSVVHTVHIEEEEEGPSEEWRERVIAYRKKKFFDQQNRKIEEFTGGTPE